jgi:hypothetical protein
MTFPLAALASLPLDEVLAAFNKWSNSVQSVAESSITLGQSSIDKLIYFFKEVRRNKP